MSGIQSSARIAEQNRINLHDPSSLDSADKTELLTFMIADQLFGIPVLQVQDVLRQQKVTHIPLAAPEISGSLNLRGRIVTAIDVRIKLGVKKCDEREMSVVVEHRDELYSLVVDRVGDVLSLSDERYEASPATLDKVWQKVSSGIYRLDDKLLVVMDVSKLIDEICPTLPVGKE